MERIETLKEFCRDEGELLQLSKEFGVKCDTPLLTKEQADYFQELCPNFKKMREEQNSEVFESETIIL